MDEDPKPVCGAVCCSGLQCVAVCCDHLLLTLRRRSALAKDRSLRNFFFVAVCCSVLQCVAVCCDDLLRALRWGVP